MAVQAVNREYKLPLYFAPSSNILFDDIYAFKEGYGEGLNLDLKLICIYIQKSKARRN